MVSQVSDTNTSVYILEYYQLEISELSVPRPPPTVSTCWVCEGLSWASGGTTMHLADEEFKVLRNILFKPFQLATCEYII